MRITLHWTCLKLPKCKTAKSLLYTVNKTENRKQLKGNDQENR